MLNRRVLKLLERDCCTLLCCFSGTRQRTHAHAHDMVAHGRRKKQQWNELPMLTWGRREEQEDEEEDEQEDEERRRRTQAACASCRAHPTGFEGLFCSCTAIASRRRRCAITNNLGKDTNAPGARGCRVFWDTTVAE
jgi:hypothetical protein